MYDGLLEGVVVGNAEPGDLIGFWRSGRPIFLIAGAEDGDGDGGDGNDDGGGSGSLLDGDDGDDGGTGGDDGGDGDGADDGDGNGSTVDADAIAAALEKRLESRFDSIADRRVNALLKEIRKQAGSGGGSGGGNDGGDAGGADDGDSGRTNRSGGIDPTVLRGARLAYREYVSGELKPISNVERDFATDLANLMLPSLIAKAGDDADDDAIGRDVAKQVGEKVLALRKHYEDKTVAALKRRGMLKDVDPSQQGGGTTRPGQPPAAASGKKGEGSDFAKGAALAQEMFGNRQPAAAAASGQ
jgi:hypothetical protein